MKYSACIELLFADETDDICQRIRLAKDAGLPAVEFWRWREKDLGAIRRTLDETGLALTSILAEPIVALTDPENRAAFLEVLKASLDAGRRVGARAVIAQTGDFRPDVDRETQHAAIVECLRAAGPILDGSGITLLVEPLNTRIDHPGYFLDSTVEGLDIIAEVGDPNIRLLYDIYHSVVMGETPSEVLDGRVDLVAHVHLADAPGRHEPGTGTMDWRGHLQWLGAHGYAGMCGLEYKPKARTTDSLGFLDT